MLAQVTAITRLVPSRKNLKGARDKLNFTCARCLALGDKAGPQLRRCGRCKGVWYCSKECQTQDWPQHKKTCNKVEDSGILKLLNAFVANNALMMYLQTCLVFQFDLIRKPSINAPFLARVDVGIEPSAITSFIQLCAGAEINSEKIEGMLQINAVTPRQPNSASEPTSIDIWRRAREEADLEGLTSDSLGIVEFHHNNSGTILSCVIHIQALILSLAKEGAPFVRLSAITGRTEFPMNAMTCIECINMQIRSDAHNRWLLRTDMKKEDIDIIRDTGRGVDREAVRILKDKMAREPIYRLHRAGSS